MELRIKDLPDSERPREKLYKFGAENLSNVELLAIILRTGNRNENVLSLSLRLLKETCGLDGLFRMSLNELNEIKGIGNAKASELMALIELSRRFRTLKSGNSYKISTPKDAAGLVMEDMRHLKQECLKVIMLTTKNSVIAIKDVSLGSINSSIVCPREIFSEAIKRNSACVIICHNHPSGDPTPSSEDISLTLRIKESGRILGIELIDHIIIGNGSYISLKEKNIV